LAANHKPRTAAYPQPWSEQATIADAFYFAKREFTAQLALFETAGSTANNAAMIEAVKKLRGVVDKLDAFRRMKVREWDAAKAANTNESEVIT
jgi:hypothetical protein